MQVKSTCPNCHREVVTEFDKPTQQAMISCPHCEHSYTIHGTACPPAEVCTWEELGEPRKTVLSSIRPRTHRLLAASLLLVVLGILGLVTAGVVYTGQEDFLPGINLVIHYLSAFPFEKIVFAGVFVIFSVFAFTGAYSAYMRRNFVFTVLCTVLAMFSIGLYVGLALGIISLWLIYTSRDEFEHGAKGKVF